MEIHLKLRFLNSIVFLCGILIAAFGIRFLQADIFYQQVSDSRSFAQFYATDKNIIQQFFIWLQHLAAGDWGESLNFNRPVFDLVRDYLPRTLELLILSAIISTMLATIWLFLGSKRFGIFGVFVSFIERIFQLTPYFAFGFLLLFIMLWFGIDRPPSFPQTHDLQSGFYFFESLIRKDFHLASLALADMLLPILALAAPFSAFITIAFYHEIKQIEHSDYVRLAHWRGLRKGKIFTSEILPNAFHAASFNLQSGGLGLIGYSVFIEYLLSYQGFGYVTVEALAKGDFALLQAGVLVFALLIFGYYLAMSLLLSWAQYKYKLPKLLGGAV